MSLLFHNKKFFLLFFFLIFPLLFLSDKCSADLNDLIKYEDKHENKQITKLASNKSGEKEEESIDISKELTIPEDLDYQLFLGLCCGKCGDNMPLNIPGAGTPEPHELRVKINLSWGKMVGLGTLFKLTDHVSVDASASIMDWGEARASRHYEGLIDNNLQIMMKPIDPDIRTTQGSIGIQFNF
jgi:hypothetical protein